MLLFRVGPPTDVGTDVLVGGVLADEPLLDQMLLDLGPRVSEGGVVGVGLAALRLPSLLLTTAA